MTAANKKMSIAHRFRGFLPVVVDVETGGLNPKTDALLEVAAVMLGLDENNQLKPEKTHFCHIQPFASAHLDPQALEITKIDPYHPFRFALPEHDALEEIFQPIRKVLKKTGCQRAILVGHNPTFDLSFIQAAVRRAEIKRNPFHLFTTFDTATLAGLVYGETVLAKAAKAAGINFNPDEAHSAIYDAERTAELFCKIVNHYQQLMSSTISANELPWVKNNFNKD